MRNDGLRQRLQIASGLRENRNAIKRVLGTFG